MPKLQDLATKVKAQVASEQDIVEQRFATAEKIFLGKERQPYPASDGR